MMIRPLPGTRGLGLVYDRFAESLYLTIGFWTWRFHWPAVARCKNCPHGPLSHKARRDHGFIEWWCTETGCECDHYNPETA